MHTVIRAAVYKLHCLPLVSSNNRRISKNKDIALLLLCALLLTQTMAALRHGHKLCSLRSKLSLHFSFKYITVYLHLVNYMLFSFAVLYYSTIILNYVLLVSVFMSKIVNILIDIFFPVTFIIYLLCYIIFIL